MSRNDQSQLAARMRRAGWWGMSLLAGALFFITGSLVSFFEGDMRIALQSCVVALLLWTGSLIIYRKRR